MYDQIVQMINSLGFPIGISIYLLVRFEKKIESLNKNISDLTLVITDLIAKQKKL